MHRVDAEGLGHRQEDRRADDDHRRQVHERADDQQHDDHHEDRAVLVAGDGGEDVHRRGRNLQVREQPAERCCRPDDEQDQAGGTHRAGTSFEKYLAREPAIDCAGHQDRVQHCDRRALDSSEHASADADEDHRHEQQARQRRDESQQHFAPAREGLDCVAAAACDPPAGDHQHDCQQQRGHDAGREQVRNRDRAAGRRGVQDQVVRGRYEQRDQRRGDRDVHGEIAIEAALDHLRDHRAADRRDIGDRRAGHAAEEQRGEHVDLAETAAQMSDQRRGECNESLGNPAAHHQLAGKYEQWNRDQRRGVRTRGGLLDHDDGRHIEPQHCRQRRCQQCKAHRHADEQQQDQDAEEDCDRHRCSSCSMEKSAIRTPPRHSGRNMIPCGNGAPAIS